MQHGLEWITKLRRNRLSREAALQLELASALAQVLIVTRGFTAPETRAAAERARDLAEKGGNLAQLVLQVYGIWRSIVNTGDYSTAALLADRILHLAQREGSPREPGIRTAVLRSTRASTAAISSESRIISRA